MMWKRSTLMPLLSVLLAAAVSPPAYCGTLPLVPTCTALVVKAPRATLRLAVVTTVEERARGLMGVASVAHAHGMLFVFPDGDAPRGFWMKDTITPLDMVFVGANGIVTSVAANVPATAPGTPDDRVAQRQGVGRFVIELGAGDAARDGIRSGTKLRLPDIPAQ